MPEADPPLAEKCDCLNKRIPCMLRIQLGKLI